MFGRILMLNQNYVHFLTLVEIFYLLNAQVFCEESIIIIEEKIFTYLNQFKTLYPGEPLTAKFHFMIHYGRSIREFGPVVQYSTMRFESKHSHFKQIDRAVHNQINLTKSITTKHQELQLFYLSSQNYFNSSEYGSNGTVSPVNLNINNGS